MRHSRAAAAVITAMLLITGCSTSAGTTPAEPSAESTPAEPVRANVPWEDYAEDVKVRIDTATEAGDCVMLQAEFDQADANNQLTMDRTGHSNADLMMYIDEAMHLADCYD